MGKRKMMMTTTSREERNEGKMRRGTDERETREQLDLGCKWKGREDDERAKDFYFDQSVLCSFLLLLHPLTISGVSCMCLYPRFLGVLIMLHEDGMGCGENWRNNNCNRKRRMTFSWEMRWCTNALEMRGRSERDIDLNQREKQEQDSRIFSFIHPLDSSSRVVLFFLILVLGEKIFPASRPPFFPTTLVLHDSCLVSFASVSLSFCLSSATVSDCTSESLVMQNEKRDDMRAPLTVFLIRAKVSFPDLTKGGTGRRRGRTKGHFSHFQSPTLTQWRPPFPSLSCSLRELKIRNSSISFSLENQSVFDEWTSDWTLFFSKWMSSKKKKRFSLT